MANTFKISVNWKGTSLPLNCELYYESAQIQRIKISYKEHSFAMQNNYPLVVAAAPGKRTAIVWKLIEGTPKDGRFLQDVMHYLEQHLKNEGKEKYINPKNDQDKKAILHYRKREESELKKRENIKNNYQDPYDRV